MFSPYATVVLGHKDHTIAELRRQISAQSPLARAAALLPGEISVKGAPPLPLCSVKVTPTGPLRARYGWGYPSLTLVSEDPTSRRGLVEVTLHPDPREADVALFDGRIALRDLASVL